MSRFSSPPITIGVSACLLGEPVRYNGGHKRHSLLVDIFPQQVALLPFCPEVGIGLPVPRSPIDLIKQGDLVTAIVRETAVEVTDLLIAFGERWRTTFHPDGYIVKSRSPSCAASSAPVYAPDHLDAPLFHGPGLFTVSLLPSSGLAAVVIEEEALSTPLLVAIFVERLFLRSRLRAITAGHYPATLRRFHDIFIPHWTAITLSSSYSKLLAVANSTDQDGPTTYATVFDQALRAVPDNSQPPKNLKDATISTLIEVLLEVEARFFQSF